MSNEPTKFYKRPSGLSVRFYPDGLQEWILVDGTRWFCRADGTIHNPNGPAIVTPEGGLQYFVDGVPHRTDGPAIMHSSKEPQQFFGGVFFTKEPMMCMRVDEWFDHGVRHRPVEDGPAVIFDNGGREYWEHGRLVKFVPPRNNDPKRQFYGRLFETLPQLVNRVRTESDIEMMDRLDEAFESAKEDVRRQMAMHWNSSGDEEETN